MSRKILSVSELTREIRGLLEDEFGRVAVRGELSGLARPGSGHLYFNVKDERAQISGVMFKTQASRLKFDLEEGMEAVFHGRITLYEPRGAYQLVVDRVEPIGEGALQLAFEQLKAKLEKRGWFKEELKKELPYIPGKIGMVTSPTGAALQDMLNVLNRRFAGIPVILAPSRVQGEGAAEEIARQIARLDEIPEVDLILVARGGGSLEDLWAFNEEVVAEAVFQAKTPVMSAVGHETDFTLVDFVADLRAPTPSAAAELAVPLKEKLVERLVALEARMRRALRTGLERAEERLQSLERRITSPEYVIQSQSQKLDELNLRLAGGLRDRIEKKRRGLASLQARLQRQSPQARLGRFEERLLGLDLRLRQALRQGLQKRREAFAKQAALLESLSPLGVLGRGYSLALDGEGRVKGSIEDFKEKQEFTIRLRDGEALCDVKQVHPKDE